MNLSEYKTPRVTQIFTDFHYMKLESGNLCNHAMIINLDAAPESAKKRCRKIAESKKDAKIFTIDEENHIISEYETFEPATLKRLVSNEIETDVKGFLYETESGNKAVFSTGYILYLNRHIKNLNLELSGSRNVAILKSGSKKVGCLMPINPKYFDI